MNDSIIYHGSINIIKTPIFHGSKPNNDYGYGFYCTESIELAKEWACLFRDKTGYANKYAINIENLKILDLTNKPYTILNWIAILVKHRYFDDNSQISKQAKEYLLKNFYIDVNQYDLIIGYRADDSYFTFARDFLNNTISLRQLSKAMSLGNLGKQIVIKSKLAFDLLKFNGFESVNSSEYYNKRKRRDENARIEYTKTQEKYPITNKDIFVLDIIRRRIKHGDSLIS